MYEKSYTDFVKTFQQGFSMPLTLTSKFKYLKKKPYPLQSTPVEFVFGGKGGGGGGEIGAQINLQEKSIFPPLLDQSNV